LCHGCCIVPPPTLLCQLSVATGQNGIEWEGRRKTNWAVSWCMRVFIAIGRHSFPDMNGWGLLSSWWRLFQRCWCDWSGTGWCGADVFCVSAGSWWTGTRCFRVFWADLSLGRFLPFPFCGEWEWEKEADRAVVVLKEWGKIAESVCVANRQTESSVEEGKQTESGCFDVVFCLPSPPLELVGLIRCWADLPRWVWFCWGCWRVVVGLLSQLCPVSRVGLTLGFCPCHVGFVVVVSRVRLVGWSYVRLV